MSVKKLPELESLLSWLGKFPRHPAQTHAIHEADSEVIRISKNLYLAATIDSVSEEIAFRLYKDPYTMGWITAMASLSDLAAVGAEPLGVLFSAQLSSELEESARKRLADGFRDALKKTRTHLLGGDSGGALSTVLSGVGLGLLDSKPTTRIGMRPGDLICITGKSGIGPALGFRHLLGGALDESLYRPHARISEGIALRGIASSSMDTSDGIASTLHTLMTLNGVGLKLHPTSAHLDARAVQFCKEMNLPVSALWFGEHGDFELVFSVPEKKMPKLKRALKNFSVIGKATTKKAGTPLRLDFLADRPKSNLQEIRSSFDAAVEYLRTAPINFE